jgi:predicted LPLAT superfamily acyltransferase
LGSWIAVAAMPEERRHSAEYLSAVLGRPPRYRETWRHFYAFAKVLMLKLRVGEGRPHACVTGPDAAPFESLMASGRPAFFGTFHLGNSDLLGFTLGRFGRQISMIRLRVENSREIRELVRKSEGAVEVIWVNEVENLLFALKSAAQAGRTIAMECDRVGFSSKLEAFQFLGRRRLFPFTIYHLALIFRRPVVFCVGVPHGPDETHVRCSPVFEPDGESKEANFSRARAHFQEFLFVIEGLLRQDPCLWFNFLPLNPPGDDAPVRSGAPS